MSLILPQNYKDLLNGPQNTEKGIKAVKEMFQENLAAQLSLLRATAPMVVLRGQTYKKDLYFHRMLLEGKLPYTIGGGIGQSRLCMHLLRKAHIGEIQSSIWPERMRQECAEAGINLL